MDFTDHFFFVLDDNRAFLLLCVQMLLSHRTISIYLHGVNYFIDKQ